MSRHKSTIIEYRNYYLPETFPVITLDGERWHISDIKSERLHFHNCLEIGICHSDSGTLEFQNTKVPFHSGDITYIPKDLPHTTYSDMGSQSLWSYIFLDPEELFRGLLTNSTQTLDIPMINDYSAPFLMVNKEEEPDVCFLINMILHEMHEKKKNYQSSVRGLLLTLCIQLFRIQQNKTLDLLKNNGDIEDNFPENALVISPALDYIRKNYMQQFSIEDLATICHFSPTHFRRVFHEIMGTSPLDYVNNTRIIKACRLLRSTEESILNISEQVGFHSISSFNRYFQKVIGSSPRTWRNQMLQNDTTSEKQAIWEFSGWL